MMAWATAHPYLSVFVVYLLCQTVFAIAQVVRK